MKNYIKDDIKALTEKVNEYTDGRMIVKIEEYEDGDLDLIFKEDYDGFEVAQVTPEQAIKYLEGFLFGIEASVPLEERAEKYGN